MKVLDLFCGTGGFSRGAHAAGLGIAAAVDVDKTLTSSFASNFPDVPLWLMDVADLTGPEVLGRLGHPVDGMIGGPPCQGFSSIGRRRPDDPRRALFGHFCRLIGELEPAFFVVENVLGLRQKGARDVLDAGLEMIPRAYDISLPLVLDASHFGAPTRRKRLFVAGVHRDRGRLPDLAALPQCAGPTVRDAIFDISNAEFLGIEPDGFDVWRSSRSPESEYALRMATDDRTFTGNVATAHRPAVVDRFSAVPQGGKDAVGRHPRLAWDGYCPTLRAGTGSDRGSYQSVRPIHPSEPRVITVREAARLQGFPDAHRFHPAVWHSFRMIGNSVPPPMAEAILSAVSKACGASGPALRHAAE